MMSGKHSIINTIDKNNLCLGCGLCESICGKENVEMKLSNDGFFHPIVKSVIKDKEKIIKRICPGTNIVNDLPFGRTESIWGRTEGIYSGFANDPETRTKGSSGGIVSAISIYLLEKKIVDAVLQVGGDQRDYLRNTLKISKTKEDVLTCSSSRYAPALIFDRIVEILENNDDVYCFIGKPCDISALKNFLAEYPLYQDRIFLTVAIMCAGMPSFNGTELAIDSFKALRPVKGLVYRGNGWPGNFSFFDRQGKRYSMSYNDSWGKILGPTVHLRCKLCPDGIGIQADVVAGDAWETKNGYPDFSEKKGQSLIIVRTLRGQDILKQACEKRIIQVEKLEKEKLLIMQPYQYRRRKMVGIRLFAFFFLRFRLLNFRNLHLWKNTLTSNPVAILREFWGTYKRILKLKY